MAADTIRRIHAMLSAALNMAVRWEWIDRNPAHLAHPLRATRSEPEPPSPQQVAELLNLVWATEDTEFAMFLWLAVTSGARRGELVALRWPRVDLEAGQLLLAHNYVARGGKRIEKATKTNQTRRLSLDLVTCDLLTDYRKHRQDALAEAGLTLPADAYVFSPDPEGQRAWHPDTMTHRYRDRARRVGITSPLKELRHYNASQLLGSGVDLRAVAGRLGHSGGGSTTLKVYAHFLRTADQRAADTISNGLPRLRNDPPAR